MSAASPSEFDAYRGSAPAIHGVAYRLHDQGASRENQRASPISRHGDVLDHDPRFNFAVRRTEEMQETPSRLAKKSSTRQHFPIINNFEFGQTVRQDYCLSEARRRPGGAIFSLHHLAFKPRRQMDHAKGPVHRLVDPYRL